MGTTLHTHAHAAMRLMVKRPTSIYIRSHIQQQEACPTHRYCEARSSNRNRLQLTSMAHIQTPRHHFWFASINASFALSFSACVNCTFTVTFHVMHRLERNEVLGAECTYKHSVVQDVLLNEMRVH
jgi:hypothetical protein